MSRSALVIASIAILTLLSACEGESTHNGPGGLIPEDAEALDEAAARLDEKALPPPQFQTPPDAATQQADGPAKRADGP